MSIDCGEPPFISNGMRIFNTTVFGSSVSYVCDEGFQIDSDSLVICGDTGDWQGQVPSCQGQCITHRARYLLLI